jgi:lipoprotein NlpD
VLDLIGIKACFIITTRLEIIDNCKRRRAVMFVCQKNNARNRFLSRVVMTLIILVSAGMTGCINSREFISTEAKFSESKKSTTFHTVKKGETLFSIAWTYGWDYHKLASANSIARPYTIYAGQKIDISNRVAAKSPTKVASVGKTSKTPIKQQKTATAPPKPRQAAPTKTILESKGGWNWPAKGKVVERFSTKKPQNKGIDIVGEKGESVNAAAAGTVVYAGKGLRGYGNLVIIKHDAKFLSAYAHTSRILVREKEKIKAGQIIAEIGSTGTNKVKLHFEIRRNGRPVDPLLFLPKR